MAYQQIQSKNKITCRSYAKINMGLQITGKRDDGFHNLVSVFRLVDLYDEITIIDSNAVQVLTRPSLGISQEENIVYKAVEELLKVTAIDYKAKIIIDKHIPNGAGLGGGSSNAATVLQVLNSHWQLSLSFATLSQIALSLGSDVPFFLIDQNRTNAGLVEGRGEFVSSFHSDIHAYIVLVYPDIHISTAIAYSMIRLHEEGMREKAFRDSVLMAEVDYHLLERYCTNDFEKPIFALHPELAAIKEQHYKAGAFFSLMSGTGSCVYGLYRTKEDAMKVCDSMKNYRTFVTTLL